MRTILALLLCCSGFAVGATERICLQPSDRIVYQANCDTQIQPIAEVQPELSAYRQSMLGRSAMLWIGGKTQAVVDRFPALIRAAKQYPNIKSVYLYDELFWTGQAVQIGLHESEVLSGAQIAHAAGLKTAISITPQAILHPDFALRDSNAFDLIAIIVYPGYAIATPQGCTFDGNRLSTALYCSYMRLLSLGYRGRIGYVAQGFAIEGTAYNETVQQFALQKQTIDKAHAMHVDAFMAWGVYLGRAEIAAEPFLQPLGGTAFEPLLYP